MSTRKAIDQFLVSTEQNKEKIDVIKKFVDGFMGEMPEDINWAHVGDSLRISSKLDEIIEIINN